jgi:hypothetical protein
MTIGSQKSFIHRYGMISQCSHDMSSMKLKNHDVQSDEKHISAAHF